MRDFVRSHRARDALTEFMIRESRMCSDVTNDCGHHYIAGHWVAGQTQFYNQPISGEKRCFSEGSANLVDTACAAAEEAFWSYGYSSRTLRAEFLRTIATEIDARADAINDIGPKETGLPVARFNGERGRTTGQLRLFADYIELGDYLDHRLDDALPNREPIARPKLQLIQRPIGPVAVFGASNFPLAFSTAGGDTASALAAGCPVIVKGHPAHPGTSEVIVQAIEQAVTKTGVDPGVFSLINGEGRDVGSALVQHPLIKAVGFTGSLAGGRALYDLCSSRAEPIPFFGELGSINPVFILGGALIEQGNEIAEGWAQSLTMGAGQFCTNPGIVFVPDGDSANAFIRAVAETLSSSAPQTMLTNEIAQTYRAARNHAVSMEVLETVVNRPVEQRSAGPFVATISGSEWLAKPELAEEVFGPFGIIVRFDDDVQIKAIAKSLAGQLTCTLHMTSTDVELAKELLPILERKAGRVLFNGFPTGVEVADAMVHGGPYPASTNFGATSVGTMAIRRFLRPVCYQNLPDALSSEDLR